MTVDEDMREMQRKIERGDDLVQTNLIRHIDDTRAISREEAVRIRSELNLAFHNHESTHEIVDSNLAEFKISVREQISNIMAILDQSKSDRAYYLTRDVYEVNHETLEKAVLLLEKTIYEKMELADTQINEKVTARINLNADRITKLEQGISVMNARNQQSIIALGILLTAVEVLIRFFAN